MPELLWKNPILRREIDLPEKFQQMNTLHFQTLSGKMCCFGRETLELHPIKQVLVHRLPNTGMEKKNLSEIQNFGGKKLMLWCFVARDGRKCLQKVCGTMNSINYLQIFQESLLPEMFWAKKFSKITVLHIIRFFQRLGFPKVDWKFSETGHWIHQTLILSKMFRVD